MGLCVALLFGCISVLADGASEKKVTPEELIGCKKGDLVVVYEKPDEHSKRFATIKGDREVTLIKKAGTGWYLISVGSTKGYIHGEKKETPVVTEAPVATEVPEQVQPVETEKPKIVATPEVKPVETPKLVETPEVTEKPVETPKPEAPAEEPKPVETSKPEAPAEEPKPAETPKAEDPSEEPKPAETPKAEDPGEEPKPTETPKTEEPSEEPSEEPAEATPVPEEPANEEPTAEEVEEQSIFTPPAPTLSVYWDARDIMNQGDVVTLSAEIGNAEYYDFTLQWQVDTGNGFHNVKGATEANYQFVVNEKLLSAKWQLVMDYELKPEYAAAPVEE